MPRVWPDPRDNEPPSGFGDKFAYLAAAVIAAIMIFNFVRGVLS